MQRASATRLPLKLCARPTTVAALRAFSAHGPNSAKWLGKKRAPAPARPAHAPQAAQLAAVEASISHNWSFSTMPPVYQHAVKSSIEKYCAQKALEGPPESYMAFLEKLHRGGNRPSAAFVEKTLHECGLFYSFKDFVQFTTAITGASALIPLNQHFRDHGDFMDLISRMCWAGIASKNPLSIITLTTTRLECQAIPPPEWGLAWASGRLRDQYWREKSDRGPDPAFMERIRSAAQDFLDRAHIEAKQFPNLGDPAFLYVIKMIVAMMSRDASWEPTQKGLELLLGMSTKPTPPKYWEITSNKWPSARTLYASMVYRTDEFLARQLLLEDLKEPVVHHITPWLLAGLENPGSPERQRLMTLSAEKGNEMAVLALSKFWFREREAARTAAERAEAHMLWREWNRLSEEVIARHEGRRLQPQEG